MILENIDRSVIDLQLLNCIERYKLDIEYLTMKIKFYNKQIYLLKDDKPLWFQRKKIREYHYLLNSYNQKIVDNYNEINNVFNDMLKTNAIINDKSL